MREAIRGTQGPSEAIRGHQRPLHSHTSQRRTASHASHSHSHSQRRTASHASQPFRRYVATVSVNVARAASGSMKQRTSLGNRSFHGMASTASGSFLHAMREAIRSHQSPSKVNQSQSESIRVNQREAIRGTQRAVDGHRRRLITITIGGHQGVREADEES